VTLLGMLIIGMLLHPENVSSYIFVTPSGIIMGEARLSHPEKAALSMRVTLAGRGKDFRLTQLRKHA
jgi:hypothetical protein